MKKVIFSAMLLTAATISSYAQSAQTPATPAVAVQNDDKVKVEPSALPDPVKKTLAGDAYKEWQIVSAWSVKDHPEVYIIDLKNGEKTQTISIDKDGVIK